VSNEGGIDETQNLAVVHGRHLGRRGEPGPDSAASIVSSFVPSALKLAFTTGTHSPFADFTQPGP